MQSICKRFQDMFCVRNSGINIFAFFLLVMPVCLIAQAPVSITLSASATPAAAQPGVTVMSLTGSGFPAGTIAPANVTVTLAPASGNGSTVAVSATAVTTLFGNSRRVTFQVPSTLSVSSPTAYLAGIHGTVTGGVSFASTNASVLTITPGAYLSSAGVITLSQGQSGSVTISGNYTNFLQGSTIASLGAGVAVGGATPGAFGPVMVTSPTSAVAQVAVGQTAALGARSITVETGVQAESLSNVLSIAAAQVSVPNVVGLTQAAATTSLTGAGLVAGTVTTQSSSTVASGSVISEAPTAGTSVNVGSAVSLVVSSGPAQVSVPNIVGLTQAAATTSLTSAGLVVGTVTTQSSSTVASGTVISEAPTAGTSVNVGSAVSLVVSSGPAQVSVPNVVGLTQAAATTSLTSAGLVAGTVTTQSSSTVASGSVISEAPAAGTSVNVGSAVSLVVSSGPAQVSVPNVVGLTQAAATTSLTSAGLVVGTVTTQSSSTVASGSVISEAPTAGTSVNVGSAVSLVISSGPAKVSVPNVVGLTQAAATTSLTSAGLAVGTVTTQSSSTVASGDVISESPAAGTSVNVGSAVNVVVSTGAASNPAVSINLQVLQQILTAGTSTTFTDVPVDQNGNPVEQTPTCGITADPTAAGTVPTIVNGTFGTAADTRGVYTLTCTLTSPALTASATLVVFLPADQTVNTQQATFSAFSESLNSSESLLQQIQSDLLSGNQTNANEALTQLQSTLNGVSLDELSGSAAFAPEGGFPASAGSLPGFGINPTAGDANVGSYLSNLIGAIQNLTTFLQTNPLATLTSAQQSQYSQMQSTFSTLVSQLPSPSAYGVVANVDQEDMLFSTVLPQYYQALLQAYIQYMTAEGFTASLELPSQRGWPGGLGGAQLVHADWSSGNARLLRADLHAFRPGRGVRMQFGGVAEIELVCEIQMDLIKQIYVPYMASIAKAAATIAIADAFQSWLGGQNLDGVITGADAEIQIFYAAPSAIEGENLNVTPSNNLVYFIGPDQVNGVINLATNVQTWVNSFAKNPPKDLNAANKALENFKSFYNKQVAYTDCLYNEGLQPPDYTQAPGNCILSFSSSCVELDYNNGFNSVYNPSGPAIPSPVIIITWNVPAGAFSVGTFDFVPATTPNPPGACVNPGSGSLLRKRHDWLFTPRGTPSEKGVPGAL